MRLATSSSPRWLLAALAGASLLAACGSEEPPASVPAEQRAAVATATPYQQPPVPTIVDPSGRVSGSGAPVTSGTGSAAREVNYTVEAGDTLLAIATQFDTTIEAIVKRNNITDPTALKIGQQLVIPSNSTVVGSATPMPTRTATPTPTAVPKSTATPSPTASATASPTATATATPTRTPGQSQTYIVQSGDNSFDIAGRFGITVEELAQANGRTVASLASIQIGDRLIIPPPR